ncbi:MAG: hypothetical protein AMXMBFR83_20770 [Phycisphaerae bacterium]
MALVQLSEEEIRSMSVEEKDDWWLKNVYKGDMPQLTPRAAITGMMIGAALSLTNLYVGAKTGWTLGVGITSVILAFAFYKVLSRIGLGREFTILENNAMQSIATAAGYMTSPLTSSLAAYMMAFNEVIPRKVAFVWIVVLSILGVLFAFPLKRRFINDEQHPFPEGRAAGIVMDALHHSDARSGLLKAKLLAGFGTVSAIFEFLKAEHAHLLEKLHLKALAIPDALEHGLFQKLGWHPRVGGQELENLSVSLAPEHVMFATGGLMGIRTGLSLFVGATVNYLILAPIMISSNVIKPDVVNGATVLGVRQFVGQWSVWPGVAILTVASLVAFFSKPKMLLDAFSGLVGGKSRMSEQMRRIELPMSVFVIGIPIVSGVAIYLAHAFFGVGYLMGVIAIPLVFVFTLIAVHSTALTSITPGGAIGKLTQLSFAALDPGNMKTNLMTAGMSGEAALNASNLLMDIKPGYMLGAKPRQQAIGHVLGIFAGAIVAVPAFYAMFLSKGPQEMVTREYGFPSALTWQKVAELLTRGIDQLHPSAATAAAIGAVVGLGLELARMAARGRMPLSPIGVGLGFVIYWRHCFAMFMGALVFWLASLIWKNKQGWGYRVVVENAEAICAGVIAGGALTGIGIKMVEQYLLG